MLIGLGSAERRAVMAHRRYFWCRRLRLGERTIRVAQAVRRSNQECIATLGPARRKGVADLPSVSAGVMGFVKESLRS